MADFIALDWEKKTLNGVEASTARGRVHARRCFELHWPTVDAEQAVTPQQTGEWLKTELQRLGVTARKVLVSLPREEVIVRQIEVPNVPEAELPELVRLQAETKLSTPIDTLVLDFLPLPLVEGNPARGVLIFTCPRVDIEELQQIVAAAGLELERVSVSSVATAELIARVEAAQGRDPGETSLTLSRHHKRVEISLMRNRHLLFSHSSRLTGDDDEQDAKLASAEIRRSIGAHSRIDHSLTVNRAWTIGTQEGNEVLCQTVAAQLRCDADIIDPLENELVTFDGARQLDRDASDAALGHAPFAGPIGMLLAVDQRTVDSVDFLDPRKAVVRTDTRKIKAGLIAAGVLVAIGVLYGGTRWRVSSLESETQDINQAVIELDKKFKDGKPTLAAASVVDDWKTHSDDWLGRMVDVNEALPGTDRVYMTGYTFAPTAGKAKGKVLADGRARTKREVQELAQKLSERGYVVQPLSVPKTSDDKDYPYSFQLDFNVALEEPKPAAATPKPSTKTRPTPKVKRTQ